MAAHSCLYATTAPENPTPLSGLHRTRACTGFTNIHAVLTALLVSFLLLSAGKIFIFECLGFDFDRDGHVGLHGTQAVEKEQGRGTEVPDAAPDQQLCGCHLTLWPIEQIRQILNREGEKATPALIGC